MLKKIYICEICKKVVDDDFPIRFIQQEYGAGRYKQYYPVDRFDLCKDCYSKIKEFVNSLKKEK